MSSNAKKKPVPISSKRCGEDLDACLEQAETLVTTL